MRCVNCNHSLVETETGLEHMNKGQEMAHICRVKIGSNKTCNCLKPEKVVE